jgi:D-alanyl-D-alanine carboxypeptidase
MRNPTVTRDAVYKIISRYPFQFPTGTMQIYSNSGFWLLSLIVEKASGMTYEDYIEKTIFEPLGVTRSMYCNNSKNIPRRAYGYGMRSGAPPAACRRSCTRGPTPPVRSVQQRRT